MLVILRDILRVRGKIFFFSREIAYLSFRGMNERIYMNRRKKWNFSWSDPCKCEKLYASEVEGTRQNSLSDISDFSRRLLSAPVPLVVLTRYVSRFWEFRKFRRRTNSVSREIAVLYEILTRVRRQSIADECWNQPKCRLEGFPAWMREKRGGGAVWPPARRTMDAFLDGGGGLPVEGARTRTGIFEQKSGGSDLVACIISSWS